MLPILGQKGPGNNWKGPHERPHSFYHMPPIPSTIPVYPTGFPQLSTSFPQHAVGCAKTAGKQPGKRPQTAGFLTEAVTNSPIFPQDVHLFRAGYQQDFVEIVDNSAVFGGFPPGKCGFSTAFRRRSRWLFQIDYKMISVLNQYYVYV